MRFGSRHAAMLGVAGVVGLTSAVLSVAAQSAHAAVTCPSVDQTTGAVSPGPAPGVNWSGCDLTGANLQFAGMTGADLSGANLTGANMKLVGLASANLSGANLTNANAFDSAMGLANLSGADFSGTNLTLADLQQANIAGARFATANLGGVRGLAVTGTPTSLPAKWFVAATTDVTGATTEYLIGPTANIAGADLIGLNLAGDDLSQLNVSNGSLANTNLTGTDLSNANLSGVQSGGIVGQPSALPAGWFVLDGYLLGPGANAGGANLAGANLTGHSLQGINFTQANLAGADLAGLDLSSVNFFGADLAGANLSNTNLNADLQQANLTNANLTGATITTANLTSVTWLHTTCPDGSNSDAYVDGCLSARDVTAPTASPLVASGTVGTNGWYTSEVTVTWQWADDGTIVPALCPASSTTTGEGDLVTLTASCADLAGNVGHGSYQVKVDTIPPTVTVTGVSPGQTYVLGAVPQPGCVTADNLSGVAIPATLKVTSVGSHGVGEFTAACAGARDMAGNYQAAPVQVSYTVVYGFGGFLSPTPGATLPKSQRTITVTFPLTLANGQPISAATASELGQDGSVRAALTGPGISRQVVTCGWVAGRKLFRCEITTPRGVQTGTKRAYSLSAWEKVAAGLTEAPPIGKALNPVVIHFR
jgi:uncharacterized protein YjbI with pentapeptide repeats